MTRTLKVLIGAAALALIGVSTASAQTGPLLGRELYLFDGGAGTTQNTVRLIAPPADSITSSWTFTLPKNAGGSNFIMVNTDGAGKTEWQDGLSLFWGIEGNCDPITPWDPNTLTGNYIGHCTDNIDFRTGGTLMNFWFNSMTSPVLQINETGRTFLLVEDGYEGLVIGGSGPTGPDAGIVLDCAYPPSVGIEVNALATGILMPTCAVAPLVGISLKAQNTGIEIDDAPTGLFITDATTGINVTGSTRSINATGTVRLNTVAADATATQILARNASNDVVYRTVAATGDVVTAPLAGTTNRLTRWTSSNQIGDASLDDNGTGTLSRTGNIAINPGGANTLSTDGGLTVAGATALNGTLTIDVADVTLSPSHVRVLTQSAAGLVGYRTIPANGDIVVSNGPLTNNGAVYTNATGQLQSVALTDGQLLIGSTGNAPSANTLTAGSGITITNGPGSITIAVTNPNPTGTTTNSTLRWSGSAWVENVNLLSTAAGNTQNNGTLTLSVANTVLDATDTRILTQDATTGLVGHRTVAATGDIVTAPIAGTTGRITRWTASNQIGDGSLDDNGTGTLSRTGAIAINPGVGNSLSTNGNLSVTGTVTLSTTNVALDATDVRVLTMDAGTGLVGYRTIPANGDIPTTNGPLTGNRALRTNASGQIESVSLTDGQLLVGTGIGPVAAALTSTGNTVTITSPGNDINLEVANPLPAPAVGNTNWTLRSNGTAWVASGVLLNDGTNINATGNMDVDGTMTINTTANDETDTRILSVDAATGLVSYRNIASGGTIPTSNGTLSNNSAVRTNGSGQLETVALTLGQLLIGTAGAPAAGSITSTGGSVTITNPGGNINLEVANPVPSGTINQTLRHNGTTWVANSVLTNDGTDIQTTGSLLVGNNLQVGDLDGDQTNIRGAVNINSTGQPNPNVAAVNVNINTTAFANITTIGSSTALNTTSVNSPVVNMPNLPTTTVGASLITTDGTQLFENTPTQVFGGMPWVIGGNASPSSQVLGTTTDNAVSLTANGISRITMLGSGGLNTTSINTAASSGDVYVGQNSGTPNDIHLNSAEIYALNVVDVTSEAIGAGNERVVVWDAADGQIKIKNLGTPVQKTKTAQAPLLGTGAVRVFTIADTFVQIGSIITVTLQDGGANPDVNDYSITVLNVAAGQFDVRLSGFMANTATKLVNYTITNP